MTGTTRIANTSISGSLIRVVSNTGAILVQGTANPQVSNTVYLAIGTLTTSPNDVSSSNVASAQVVNFR